MGLANHRCATRAAAGVTLALALGACGAAASSDPATGGSGAARTAARVAKPVGASKISVAISDYSFHPATLTVDVDTRLTFINHDDTAHTATSAKLRFDTGTINPGRSATVELNKRGTYVYYCQFHPFMRATIIVK